MRFTMSYLQRFQVKAFYVNNEFVNLKYWIFSTKVSFTKSVVL